MKSIHKAFGIVAAIALSAGLLCCVACSSDGYSLDKDVTFDSGWGLELQYKIDPDWKEGTDLVLDDSFTKSYDATSGGYSILLDGQNPKSETFKYSVTKTLDELQAYQEQFYSKSAADQAAWYKDNMADSDGYDEAKASPDAYYDFLNYAVEELEPVMVGEDEFRVFKQTYTTSYSDAAFEKAKADNPDVQQTNDLENYYAVLIDDDRNFRVQASSEQLLRDFMATLQITW